MQLEEYYADGRHYDCEIPDADIELMPGVKWGQASRILTPAFWRFHCLTSNSLQERHRYRLGESLREEVVACLLGGHGIAGETGLAAFNHLKSHGILAYDPQVVEVESLLREPLNLGGNAVHYRYPKQKAKYVAAALAFLTENPAPPQTAVAFRNWLLGISGVGHKTAGWITRNWLDSDDVAILDIHIHRAGVIAGFYSPNDDVSRKYLEMEEQFLAFANAINIPAGVLDNQIWNQMRIVPTHVRHFLIDRGTKSTDKCGLPAANYGRTPRNYQLFSHA